MKSILYDVFRIWKIVFSEWKYSLLALVVAFSFYLLNAMIAQWKNLLSVGFVNIDILFTGFYFLVTKTSFASVIILSILTGMLVSLIFFQYNRVAVNVENKKYGVLSSAGIFLSFFVPGCAACGIGLVAVFGLASSLATLPFKGTEISFLAIILMAFALYSVSKNLLSCKLIKK